MLHLDSGMSKSAKKNKKKLQKKAAARSQEAKATVTKVQDERITIRDQLQEQLDLAKQQQVYNSNVRQWFVFPFYFPLLLFFEILMGFPFFNKKNLL